MLSQEQIQNNLQKFVDKKRTEILNSPIIKKYLDRENFAVYLNLVLKDDPVVFIQITNLINFAYFIKDLGLSFLPLYSENSLSKREFDIINKIFEELINIFNVEQL